MAFNAEQTKKAQAAIVIAVLVLAVILLVVVLSGALTPKAASVSQAGSSAATATTSGSAAANTTTNTGTSAAATGAANSSSDSSINSMDDVNAMYGTAAKQLQAQHEADPDNPSTLLNLANGYFDWGVAALNYADSSDSHVQDIFSKAIASYDEYLKGSPSSKSATVDRAICVFYSGDTSAAITALETFTAKDASFGPAWANLGMFYESAGRTDDAKAAYQKAIDADPDDAYQVKTYAQQRLTALNKN